MCSDFVGRAYDIHKQFLSKKPLHTWIAPLFVFFWPGPLFWPVVVLLTMAFVHVCCNLNDLQSLLESLMNLPTYPPAVAGENSTTPTRRLWKKHRPLSAMPKFGENMEDDIKADRSTISTNRLPWENRAPKDWQVLYCPLVIFRVSPIF